MKTLIASLTLISLAGIAAAQDLRREEIRRVPVPGSDTMEVVVNRLVVPPGATIPLHSHPGDEHAVVITDTVARAPNGNEISFAIGTPLYFPDGEVHGGLTNIGDADMVAITTSVVRSGEAFSTPAE